MNKQLIALWVAVVALFGWHIASHTAPSTAPSTTSSEEAPHTFGAAGAQPAYPNPYWATTGWFIDYANVTTCASDNNNCTQSTCGSAGSNQGPCATYAEISRRCGTPSVRSSRTLRHYRRSR